VDGIFHAVAQWAQSLLADLRGRRWLRRTVATVFIVLILYTLGGFFGAPYALRRVLTGPVATALKRPVMVGGIAFNPFRLKLRVSDLHVADRDPQRPFVDLKHLRVKVSWTSLWRLAPVVGEFYTDGLAVHVVRTGDQTFNFSDLIVPPANAPPPPPPPANAQPTKPQRFAVSNIQLNDGEIDFDDQTLHQQHRVEHIRLAVPFIANLPADVDIFVQPFLQMIVDGSRFRLVGHTQPFGPTLDTIVNLSLHRLALAPYMAYVPKKLPVKLTDGMLSALIQLHFLNANSQPHIELDGGAALEKVDLRDAGGAPLLSLGRLVVTLDNVRPLESVVHLKRIYLEGLNAHLIRNADGTTNLTALAGSPASTATPRAVSSPAATIATPLVAAASPTPTPPAAQPPLAAQMQLAAPSPTPQPQSSAAAQKPPLDFALGTFEMADSAVDVSDRSQAKPAVLALNAIHARLDGLHTLGAGLAPFALNANLASGGALAVKGNLDLANQQATTDATLNAIDLAGLKAFAAPFLNADLSSGKLTAQASVKAAFAPARFNVHVEPANAAIDDFALKGPDGQTEALGWGKFAVTLGQFDLSSRQAVVNEVRADGLRVAVKRDHKGQIDLLALVRQSGSSTASATVPPIKVAKPARAHRGHQAAKQPQPAPLASATSAVPGWKYHVLAVVLDKAEIHVLDEHGAKPVKLDVLPLGLNVKDISDDLSTPIGLELDGIVNSKGSFKFDGTVVPAPLDAKLRIATKRLDLSAINAYLGNQVNATIASALLTMNGVATATSRHDHLRAGYHGDITLGGVRIIDKLTHDNFLRWSSFSANRIAADYGEGQPKVRIGGLALSNFYARIILNSNGTLNLKDITSNPHAAPVSLTRPNAAGPSLPATPSPAPSATPASNSAPAAPQPLPAAIELGGITLQGGRINYTDNFIQPHYSADLTDVGGKIGAFGTSSTKPADVLLEGQVNGSAPLKISGAVNPLSPLAYVDIAAKADGIELPGLSAYSTRYTGYPIVKGTLTVDVHYLLDNQKLTATNHIVIDQFTFGDKVESKDALNLPVRLAIALLKDSRGIIDLTIPVSGSLSDPQFSIGGVIWGVLKNLILKAVTSPFSLIAGAFGGSGGGEQLNYIAFNPGYAQITPDAEKQLDTIAKALTLRPALKLNIAGRVDPRVDHDGLRLAKVDQQVLEQKIKDTGEPEGGAPVTVGKDEYNEYLTKAYKAAKFDKPRNMLGLTKSIPPDEMIKLLAANEKVTDDDLRHLADARANAVRAALSKRKIEPARLFIVPPKLNADDIKDQSKTTRTDLTLE
jgi:hypothetical protein